MTSTPYRSKAFLDLNNQPNCVCNEYVEPKNIAFGRIKGLSLIIILQMRRSKFDVQINVGTLVELRHIAKFHGIRI